MLRYTPLFALLSVIVSGQQAINQVIPTGDHDAIAAATAELIRNQQNNNGSWSALIIPASVVSRTAMDANGQSNTNVLPAVVISQIPNINNASTVSQLNMMNTAPAAQPMVQPAAVAQPAQEPAIVSSENQPNSNTAVASPGTQGAVVPIVPVIAGGAGNQVVPAVYVNGSDAARLGRNDATVTNLAGTSLAGTGMSAYPLNATHTGGEHPIVGSENQVNSNAAVPVAGTGGAVVPIVGTGSVVPTNNTSNLGPSANPVRAEVYLIDFQMNFTGQNRLPADTRVSVLVKAYGVDAQNLGNVQVSSAAAENNQNVANVYSGTYGANNNNKVSVNRYLTLDFCNAGSNPSDIVLYLTVVTEPQNTALGTYTCRIGFPTNFAASRASSTWSGIQQCNSGNLGQYSFRLWYQTLGYQIDRSSCNGSGVSALSS